MMTLSKEDPSSSSEIKSLPRYLWDNDATYWLKWTARNDVSGRASGVGRRGWNVVYVGLCCMLHWSISYFPLFPFCTQIWWWVNNGFPHHDTPWTCSVVCVCANVDGVPLQKSVSLYFAILMGVRVHSSCFAYSEAPDCSFPGALELQSSWKCPRSNSDLS